MVEAFLTKTSTKLMLGYGIMALVIAAISLLAAIRLNQISAAVSNLTNDLAADLVLSKGLVNQVLLARLSANQYIRVQNQTDLDQFYREFARLKALVAQAGRQITKPERVELLNRINAASKDYGRSFGEVSMLIKKRHQTQSEILNVQELLIENKLTALRIRILSLNEPAAFLAISNARNAFQLMRLNSVQFITEGDERYVVLFESNYKQVQTSLASLETVLQDAVQQKNLADVQLAADKYHQGFQTIHADHVELKDTFETKLDALDLEISDLALAVVANIEREFADQNEFLQRLILQTRLTVVVTTIFALLAGLGLAVVFNRRIAERERATMALRDARDRLEVRVTERTAELTLINQQLQQEILERRQTERALQVKNEQLQDALTNVKQLSGLLPICASCKKIRDDAGYWHQIEVYIHQHSEADFSHGICPECKVKLYPEIFGDTNS